MTKLTSANSSISSGRSFPGGRAIPSSRFLSISRGRFLDNPAWAARRNMAFEWLAALYDNRLEIP